MSLSTVRLRNAVFYAHHGVRKEEHQIGGRYEVDIAMELELEDAAREDDLSRTVDYEKVFGLIQKIVTCNRFFLIERLAYLIAHRLLEEFGFVRRIEVTVRKPNPPIGGTCDSAEVVYRTDR